MNELESLLVKLLGDSSSYKKMMDDAEQDMERAKTLNDEATVTANKYTNASERMAAAHRIAAETVAKTGGSYKVALQEAMVQIREMNEQTSSLSEKFEKLGGSMMIMGHSAIQAGSGLKSFGFGNLMKGLEAAGKYEQTTVAFRTMLQSGTEAQELLSNLTNFAAKTPFEMPEIEQAARGLVQFGERGQELMDTLRYLGNAASGTSSNFGEVALIFNQVRGVGKLLTQDFRQLSTRGIISLEDIANHFGTTKEAANEMISSGKVGFEDLRAIFKTLSEEGGRFGNMMEQQSETYMGMMSTLKDSVNIAWRQIGESILPIVSSFMKPLIAVANGIGEMSKEAKMAIAVTLALAGTVGTLAVAYGTTLVTIAAIQANWVGLTAASAALRTNILALVTAQNLLNVSIGVGYVAAVAAAAAAGFMLGKAIGDQIFGVNDLNDALEKSTKLNNELREAHNARFQDTLKEIKGSNSFDQQGKIEEELKRAKTELQGYNDGIKMQEKTVKGLEPTLWSLYQSGKKVWEAEKQSLLENTKLRDDQKKRVEELQKMLDAYKPEEVANEANQGAQKTLDALEKQFDMYGKTAQEAEIAGMIKAGVDQKIIDSARAMYYELDQLDQNKKEDEYIASLKEEMDAMGRLAKETELLALEKMNLSEAAKKEAKALIEAKHAAVEHNKLMEEGKQLTQSMRTPLEVYNEEVSRLAKLKNEGAISGDTFNRAMLKANEAYIQAADLGNNFNSTLRDTLFSMRDFSPTIVGLTKDLKEMGADVSITPNLMSPPAIGVGGVASATNSTYEKSQLTLLERIAQGIETRETITVKEFDEMVS